MDIDYSALNPIKPIDPRFNYILDTQPVVKLAYQEALKVFEQSGLKGGIGCGMIITNFRVQFFPFFEVSEEGIKYMQKHCAAWNALVGRLMQIETYILQKETK